jgi:hypothetical protein
MADDLLNELDQVQEKVEVEESVSEKKRSKAYPDKAKALKESLQQNDDDLKEPKKAGRPATGIKRSVFSASLDNNLIAEINELAKSTGLSKAALTEMAFELFMEEKAPFYREMLGKK